MGRYREYMTGSRLRDPSTSSQDRKSSHSQVSSSSSSDPNFMSFRRRARLNAGKQDRTTDSRNEYHKPRTTRHESYHSKSPNESQRRRGRQPSYESPAPKRRRRDSRDDEKRFEHHNRRSSPSPMRRGDRKEEYRRGRQRNSDARSASPPRHRRESSRNRKRSLASHESSHSPASRHRFRESRSHHQQSQRKRSRSHSPRRRQHRSPPRVTLPAGRSHVPLPSQEDAFATKSGSYRPSRFEGPSRSEVAKTSSPPPPKQAPNYAPTGLLAAETNTVANTSIVLKYHEPSTARLPPSSDQWRMFVFKGDSLLSTMNLYERTCWLFGRERLIADCATDHPSCSKQHAVIQFRFTQVKNEEGELVSGVRPYLIDLESSNGTKLNAERIPEKRYVELKTADVITFGQSEREYVIILPPKK